jgi:hypothetical protein
MPVEDMDATFHSLVDHGELSMKNLGAIILAATAVALGASSALAAGNGQPQVSNVVVSKFATTSVSGQTGTIGPDIQGPIATEIQKPKRLGTSPLRRDPAAGEAVPLAPGVGAPTSSGKKAKSNPEVNISFEGVNHRNSRLAYGGNQFSGEPADQGLCVGNGYILESVNSALRVYDAGTGTPLSPVLALNQFYGFPPAINRTTGEFGPFTFDISCHYDPDSNRWFHLAVDLDQDPDTGDFTGKNYLDLAVSRTGDPTGEWVVYRIPGMNDGTEGTPNHNCPGGPCFADFPHIGVDKNGVYITTNEFPLFDDGFTGAQVYAMSKSALASGASSLNVVLFDTSQPAWRVRENEPGFTLWPALSAGKQFDGAQRGTNYFVSSNAVFDDANGDSNELIVWALRNTKSLDSAQPSPSLTRTIVPSIKYAVPPPSVQKDGTIPLGEVFYGATEPGLIDTSDSRVLDARYANGKLWAVLGTAAEVAGEQRAGVAWFVLGANVSSSGVSAKIRKQGILAVDGESLAYPTVGVTESGRGVIGFTRVGENLFPSVGYASIDDVAGVGEVHMIREGQSPQDGFTEYGSRPRWGDYGAAAVYGHNVYLAGQYIEQPPCTAAQFIATGGSCFGFRTTNANWSTRVTGLAP